MKDARVKPEFALHVHGDWYTIIAVREYRDALLDQKPYDEDDAQYKRYALPCRTAKELFAAYQAFSAEHLRCDVAVTVESPTLGVTCFAATGTGYERTAEPFADVQIEPAVHNATMADAIATAIDVLKKAR